MFKYIMSVIRHRHRVFKHINKFSKLLKQRGVKHDMSKFEDIEFDAFENAEFNASYGTPEYDAQRNKVKDAIVHHYANNPHHIEHHPNSINDMNLIDLVEMLCDWIDASERNENDNIYKSLEINRIKYNMSDQVYNLLVNTAIELHNAK